MQKWIVFSAGFPAKNPRERLRVWRRLSALGAVSLKTGMWVLPDRPQQREGVAWLAGQVDSLGGEAIWVASEGIGGMEDAAVVELFRQARQVEYEELCREIEAAQAKLGREDEDPAGWPVRLAEAKAALRRFARRLDALKAVDFFPEASLTMAETTLDSLARLVEPKSGQPGESCCDPALFQGLTWVTRTRPEIDRLASAWLISRFIDKSPRFAFVPGDRRPTDEPHLVFYDMAGARFSHEGELVTAEVLARRFSLTDPRVGRICRLVHQVDLLEDDGQAGGGEAALIRTLLSGLHALHADDHELIKAGCALFDALYAGLAQDAAVEKRPPEAPAKARKKPSGRNPRT